MNQQRTPPRLPVPVAASGDYRIAHLVHNHPDMKRHHVAQGDRALALYHDRRVIMADTPRMRTEHAPLIDGEDQYAGKHLVLGGLGVAMDLRMARQQSPGPSHITVIESSRDVVDLVWMCIPTDSRLSLIVDDMRNLEPATIKRIVRCDEPIAVWLDIWPGDDGRHHQDRIDLWEKWQGQAEWLAAWPMRPLCGGGRQRQCADGGTHPWQ